MPQFSERLFGSSARCWLVLLAAAIMLLFWLDGRELWTQEWRWANISWQMIYSGDYLHPYLAGVAYYDKPLLSYWVMIAVSHLVGGLNTWALRLPPALAGVLTVYCTYRLGKQLTDKRVGFVAAWMLITTYYFIFWARTANSDMLNAAGTMLAVVWYFARREKIGFVSYAIFFLILAVTSLFKGLIGAIIPLIAIFPDLIKDQNWKKHLRWSFVPALIPAVIVYVLPFLASSHFGGQAYSESGLYEVYRENVMRYFVPFDHKGPIYTYIIFLPVYMLPWAFFLFPALWALPKRWREMPWGARWMAWSTLLIFLFFTFSGSRRNYYTLPLVPFATLLTAEWIAAGAKRLRWAAITAVVCFILFFVSFDIIQSMYYIGGSRFFAQELKKEASAIQPWSDWQIIFLDARSKLTFYLDPAKPIKILGLPDQETKYDKKRDKYTQAELIKNWPLLREHKPDVLFVTRQLYLDKLKPYLKNYKIVETPPCFGDRLLGIKDEDAPVAFVPN